MVYQNVNDFYFFFRNIDTQISFFIIIYYSISYFYIISDGNWRFSYITNMCNLHSVSQSDFFVWLRLIKVDFKFLSRMSKIRRVQSGLFVIIYTKPCLSKNSSKINFSIDTPDTWKCSQLTTLKYINNIFLTAIEFSKIGAIFFSSRAHRSKVVLKKI